ncbi:hypothetical protein FDP41_004286 [Naegleria fowleri]|uniref:Uncharacterized protein n=1 Tax=Naegleria fowleri TaxID=5763 RepID=A0A6A5BRS0_NAEFO|nr:uncharacterized protein FDP41_004286 [Naegleria fowleri]KAF0976991.1 hypothetical protein FDP41_004286 [Naegleria fowleri]CAG4716270.1 unnamed protein product [Naegleria fowleri]
MQTEKSLCFNSSSFPVVEIPSSSEVQQKKKYFIPNTSGYDYDEQYPFLSNDLSQQTKQAFHNIVKAFQEKIPNFVLSWIEHMVITVQREEDFSSCLSVLMKEFNYQLPACRMVVAASPFEEEEKRDHQVKPLVQLQATCSVPHLFDVGSSFSQSEEKKKEEELEFKTITRYHVGQRYSESAAYANVLYVSGQVPEDDGKKDIKGQTKEVLDALDQRLKEAGTDKTKLLMVQIFLASMEDFNGMNEVWDQWVPKENAPPRATVEAKLARPYWRIELVATAALL